MYNDKFPQEKIEKNLETYFQTPAPSPEFLKTLENQLKDATEREKKPGFLETLSNLLKQPKMKWASVPALIIIALAVGIFAIGPSRALATVQGWLRYVPGYGFVDDDAARALKDPVTSTKDDAEVMIKTVMANTTETYVVIGVEGGPTEDEIYAHMQPQPGEDAEARLDRIIALYETDARLILPDGTILEDLAFSGAYWDGFLVFPPLPQDTLSATLEISRLPGVPAGWMPEGWYFDLEFVYVAEPSALDFHEPRYIDARSESLYNFNARVLDVVYTETEIAIRVEFENLPESWNLMSAYLDAKLEDETGREYSIIYGPRSGRDETGIYTITFAPPWSDAKQLTLTINQIFLDVAIQGQAISVDFGDNPAIGDRIELNTSLDVLGQQVVVEYVHIQDEPDAGLPVVRQEPNPPVNIIAFYVTAPKNDSGIEIQGLNFNHEARHAFGGGTGGMTGGLANTEGSDQNTIVLTLNIAAEEPLPAGAYELPLQSANVMVNGPLQISWEIER